MYDFVENVNNSKRIVKIVITGGPCSGKSTFLPRLKLELSDYNWIPLILHETASELITGGIAPWTCRSNAEYHLIQMRLQLMKEKLALEAAEGMDANKIVILCDRGLMDAKAYMSESEFRLVCTTLGFQDETSSNPYIHSKIFDRYSAVFHLDTVANGFSELYSTSNNEARHESIEEAISQDTLTRLAWENHPCWKLISSSKDKEDKYQLLLHSILDVLSDNKTI